ncbi:MAG: hypothetical protein QOJ89_1103 [bacterium]
MSVRRSAAVFGTATVLGHLSQLVWLAAASRAMSAEAFGTVLAAQALYAVLQIFVDIGTSTLGARTVARGELTGRARGELVRIRMTLVLAAAPVALVLGAAGVSGSLAATAPFVVALGLFGALNVWVPYGAGDARPWATYIFARSAVLAAAATGFALLGSGFPAPLAGTLECVVLVFVIVVYRQRALADLRAALAVRGGPWRAVGSIGAPPVLAQASMAAGTLILSGAGRPAAAGIFAACVRLLSGLNAINGIVVTAMYPRLAQVGADSGRGAALVTVALRLIAIVAAATTAACVLAGQALTTAFIGADSDRAAVALALTAAAAVPLGNIIVFGYQLVARGFERAVLLPFVVGAVATIGGGLVAVAAGGAQVDIVAGTLAGGQLLAMAALALRFARRSPELSGAAAEASAVALLVALLACAAIAERLRVPAGVALLAIAAVMSWRIAPALWTLAPPSLRLRHR